jgi:hypothetical protein
MVMGVNHNPDNETSSETEERPERLKDGNMKKLKGHLERGGKSGRYPVSGDSWADSKITGSRSRRTKEDCTPSHCLDSKCVD